MNTLEEISELIIDCRNCKLSTTRTHAVPGIGSKKAKIIFIGEAPGKKEDERGEPFIGAAGKYLNQLLEIAGLERKNVFITNILKCRPRSNRDPLLSEIAACSDYLTSQINVINPRVIVTLGSYSLKHWLPNESISNIHGSLVHINNLSIFPMYHPAAALYRGNLRQIIEDDYKKLGTYITNLTNLTNLTKNIY